MKATVTIVTLLLLTSCAVRQAPLGQPVSGPDYAYEKVGEHYHVFARTKKAYMEAYDRLCKGHVCRVEREGEIFIFLVTP